jgi:hypothetical protein
VSSRVTVKLTGAIGLEDADRLLNELTKETGLDWHEESPPDVKNLGVWDLLLTAVISGAAGKGAEATVEATSDRVREVVRRWRDRRLDPPNAEVETREVPAEQPEAENPVDAEKAD